METILGICTIAITVCISLLVYNNMNYTKKVASETARKVAEEIIKKTIKKDNSLDNKKGYELLVQMAFSSKNLDDRKEYLEAALKKCDNEEAKKKIQSMIDATQKAIDNNYLPDIL